MPVCALFVMNRGIRAPEGPKSSEQGGAMRRNSGKGREKHGFGTLGGAFDAVRHSQRGIRGGAFAKNRNPLSGIRSDPPF